MLVKGQIYTRQRIQEEYGIDGSEDFSEKLGKIVCVFLAPSESPQAPKFVFVGNDGASYEKAIRLSQQRESVAVFLKRSDDQWEYSGDHWVVGSLQTQEEIEKYTSAYGRNDVSLVIKMHDQKRVALHEAGHALIGCKLGLKIVNLSITPDGNELGRCIFEAADLIEEEWVKSQHTMEENKEWFSSRSAKWLKTRIRVMMAGYVTERELLGEFPHRQADQEPELARHISWVLAKRIPSRSTAIWEIANQIYSDHELKVKEEIQKNADTVRALANRLLDSSAWLLCPEDVQQIIDDGK